MFQVPIVDLLNLLGVNTAWQPMVFAPVFGDAVLTS